MLLMLLMGAIWATLHALISLGKKIRHLQLLSVISLSINTMTGISKDSKGFTSVIIMKTVEESSRSFHSSNLTIKLTVIRLIALTSAPTWLKLVVTVRSRTSLCWTSISTNTTRALAKELWSAPTAVKSLKLIPFSNSIFSSISALPIKLRCILTKFKLRQWLINSKPIKLISSMKTMTRMTPWILMIPPYLKATLTLTTTCKPSTKFLYWTEIASILVKNHSNS